MVVTENDLAGRLPRRGCEILRPGRRGLRNRREGRRRPSPQAAADKWLT